MKMQNIISLKAAAWIAIVGKVQSDRGRKDLQPVPLAIYEIESEQGRDKGIITLAEIVGEVDVERFHSDKHS